MKVSVRWIKELAPKLLGTPQALADRLTRSGIEVEGIADFGAKLDAKIITVLVTDVVRHPEADRLSICTVQVKSEKIQVVCGAPNVKAGKKFVLAQIGAVLPNGLTIAQTQLRGVTSNGMLCSQSELGLGEGSGGLLELDDETPLNKSVARLFGDTILEVAIPPNRGDLLSHVGIARELSFLSGIAWSSFKSPLIKGFATTKAGPKVKIHNKKLVTRYMARVVDEVTIGSSPLAVRLRLESVGFRAINHVVDATNYVMCETGHPLHAFDERDINGGILTIDAVKSATQFATLDGVARDLLPGDLVICDASGPVALAGIMGGKNSEVKSDTLTLVVEAAVFSADQIRKTSRRLALHTESSHRFEREVSVESLPQALARVISLIVTWGAGKASHALFDSSPALKSKNKSIILREVRLQALTGLALGSTELKKILTTLGLVPKKVVGGWKCSVPAYRKDLTREIDLIEEVVRLTGFDKIPSVLPKLGYGVPAESNLSRLEDRLISFFVDHGFFETIHYSFGSPEVHAKAGFVNKGVLLENPLSADLSELRPSLLPALLSAYIKNKGALLWPAFIENRTLFNEDRKESRSIAGLFGTRLEKSGWQSATPIDFYFGKGLLEQLFNIFKIPVLFKKGEASTTWHPGQVALIYVGDILLGTYGALHPRLLSEHDIKDSVWYFEINGALFADLATQASTQFVPFGTYPAIERDIALVVDRTCSYDQIQQAIEEFSPALLVGTHLFDVYTGEHVPHDKKSIAIRLKYQDSQKTLTDEEVSRVHASLLQNLCQKLGASLRE